MNSVAKQPEWKHFLFLPTAAKVRSALIFNGNHRNVIFEVYNCYFIQTRAQRP